jgi:hypothetical protein
MKFKTAVRRTNEVKDAYRPGIGALQERDRNRLSFADTRKIRGSINLDCSLAELYPNQPRWIMGLVLRKIVQKTRSSGWKFILPKRMRYSP